MDIDGTRIADADELEEHMNMKESAVLRLRPQYHYLPGLVPVDRERIERYLANRSLYDARVRRFEVEVEDSRPSYRRCTIPTPTPMPTPTPSDPGPCQLDTPRRSGLLARHWTAVIAAVRAVTGWIGVCTSPGQEVMCHKTT